MVRIVLNQMGWKMSHDDTYDMILRRKDPCSILSCLLFCVHNLGLLRIIEHYFPLLSNSCKTRRNTTKDEQKYQPIFLLVFSGSCVTKSQVY